VLTGERAAHAQHRLEEVGGGGVPPLALPGPAGIDKEGHVEVAVAEVAEVDHGHLVAGADPLGAGDQLADAIARDDDVLVDLPHHHRGHGGADRLADLPEPGRIGRAGGALDPGGAGGAEGRSRSRGLRTHRRLLALQLH
jgi:hypothetical protein